MCYCLPFDTEYNDYNSTWAWWPRVICKILVLPNCKTVVSLGTSELEWRLWSLVLMALETVLLPSPLSSLTASHVLLQPCHGFGRRANPVTSLTVKGIVSCMRAMHRGGPSENSFQALTVAVQRLFSLTFLFPTGLELTEVARYILLQLETPARLLGIAGSWVPISPTGHSSLHTLQKCH